MHSSGVSAPNSHHESPQYAQERLRDSSSNNRAVDTLSDKALRQTEEVDRSQRYPEKNPSAVYIRSESRYESSYSASIRSSKAGPVDERISSETAAGSILSFIENQLLRDIEDGASEEELSSRIEAGLSGFLQGFESAREDLEALGALTPGVESEIGKTYDSVLAGIEDLRQQFLGGAEASKGGEVAAEPISSSVEEPAPALRAQSQYFSYEAAQRNSFSFSVTTQDGDTVTIQSSALRSMFQESLTQTNSSRGSLEYSQYGYGEEYQFALQVDGELDSDEMKALTELLSQVNDLAEDFFAGDVTAAFDAALSLGYDDSEISSFALNLSQTSVQRVTSAYSETRSEPASVAESLRPVGSFSRALIEATQTAQTFQNPRELIESIAEAIDVARPEGGFKSFLERLMESLEL